MYLSLDLIDLDLCADVSSQHLLGCSALSLASLLPLPLTGTRCEAAATKQYVNQRRRPLGTSADDLLCRGVRT